MILPKVRAVPPVLDKLPVLIIDAATGACEFVPVSKGASVAAITQTSGPPEIIVGKVKVNSVLL